jgi:hypothetical protein
LHAFSQKPAADAPAAVRGQPVGPVVGRAQPIRVDERGARAEGPRHQRRWCEGKIATRGDRRRLSRFKLSAFTDYQQIVRMM